jgi:hypothetical protein
MATYHPTMIPDRRSFDDRPYGWRFLRSAYFRLTTARPTETAQHRVMREAILATSELPDRLRAAQNALRDSNP